MCTSIALPTSDLPVDVVEALAARVHERTGVREVRFDWRCHPVLLPVWLFGRLQVVRWGNRDRADRKLPPTGWTWRESVEGGKWASLKPEPVLIPAAFAHANGVWLKLKQGVRGLAVRAGAGEPVVYIICEPATRYYTVMTRDEWMPVLDGEVI